MQTDRSEKIARRQLGDSFEVRTIVWRLKPIHRELVERCKREQRPLRVLSICDGIAGCLAALNRETSTSLSLCVLFTPAKMQSFD